MSPYKLYHLHQVRKHNHVLELGSQPDEIERILVHRDLLGQGRRIVTTKPRAAVRVDADAKVADARLQMGISSNVVEGGVEVVVDLRGVGMRLIGLVVDGEQEDAGDQRRGGRATGEQQCWSERAVSLTYIYTDDGIATKATHTGG